MRLSRLAPLAALFLSIAVVAPDAGAAPPKKPRPTKPKPPKPGKPAPEPTDAAPPPLDPSKPLPKSVNVSVAEVAGEYAYLKPGASYGVRRGSKVTLRGREYTVVSSTATYAVIQVSESPPSEADKGSATTMEAQADAPTKLPPPRPAEAFQNVWPAAVAPSSRGPERLVPLGGESRSRKLDVRLSASGGAIFPLDQKTDAIGQAELRARVHAEPTEAAPIAFDVDAAVQRWFAGDLSDRLGTGSRPLIRVNELQLSYGRARGFFAALGRMRYAATMLGGLDGARVQAPLGANASIGAFGGVLPNPLSLEPSLASQRFGVEAKYGDEESALRPEAALVATGSTYDGKLDERRVMGLVGLYPGPARLGGHFELSSFDKDNPWKASPIELTAAGVDASVRAGPIEVGARGDVRMADRSRYLASFLPSSWLCTTTPAAPTNPPVPEACGTETPMRGLGAVDAGLTLGNVSLMVGGTMLRDLGGEARGQLGGFAHGRVIRIARVIRFDASGGLSSGPYTDMLSWSAGPGASLLRDRLDVSAYYRQSSLKYRVASEKLLQHAAGGMLMLFPSSDLLFTLQSEATTGDDAKALLVFLTALWRPTF